MSKMILRPVRVLPVDDIPHRDLSDMPESVQAGLAEVTRRIERRDNEVYLKGLLK